MQPATETKPAVNLVSTAEAAPAAEAPAAPSSAPRSRAKFVLLFVFLLAAAGGVYAWLHYQDRVSTDDATVDGHLSAIAPKISGNVIEVLIKDNQPVKTGDVLVRIDPRDYQAKVDLAKAALMEAESRSQAAQQVVPLTNDTTQSAVTAADADLADANAELDRSRLAFAQASGSDLAFAEANVAARQAANDRAQADLNRMKPLVDKSEISSLQFDSYNAAARVAASELKAAQEKLASARQDAAIRQTALNAAQSRVDRYRAQMQTTVANRKQVPIRRVDAGTASAVVAAARANLEAAELQLSYTTITAPVDGAVTRKSVEIGQMVAPGQSLLTVIPLNDIFVTANFKETQLAGVHAGQRAEVDVDMLMANPSADAWIPLPAPPAHA